MCSDRGASVGDCCSAALLPISMPENNHQVADLPPALTLNLDREQFTQNVIVFAVGLPIGHEFKRIFELIRNYSTGYLNLPKFKNTYSDHVGCRRKLTFIRSTDSKNVCMDKSFDNQLTSDRQLVNFENLANLNVDIPESPCSEFEDLLSNPDAVVPSHLRDTLQPDGLPSRPCAVRLKITYQNLSLERILKSILPPDVDAVTGFSVIGHIAHFNLKPDALPYRKLIGEVVLDKISRVHTVLHKASKIDSNFRTFAVDLMAGEPDYLTSVKESGITFKLDFSQVYWNPRLATEHSRIVAEIESTAKNDSLIGPQVTVYDVFAGVGPFAIPLARMGFHVFANDLNPASHRFLVENVKYNSSKRHPITTMECFQMDGRDFIRKVVLSHYLNPASSKSDQESSDSSLKNNKFFILMNLPGLAIDFLDAFRPEGGWPDATETQCWVSPPINVRCYCFVRHQTVECLEGQTESKSGQKLETADKEAKERVQVALGIEPVSIFRESARIDEAPLGRPRICDWRVRFVRNVAPYKDMYCVEFLLYLPSVERYNPPSVPEKRSRIE